MLPFILFKIQKKIHNTNIICPPDQSCLMKTLFVCLYFGGCPNKSNEQIFWIIYSIILECKLVQVYSSIFYIFGQVLCKKNIYYIYIIYMIKDIFENCLFKWSK